jgi:hypothetical protein
MKIGALASPSILTFFRLHESSQKIRKTGSAARKYCPSFSLSFPSIKKLPGVLGEGPDNLICMEQGIN